MENLLIEIINSAKQDKNLVAIYTDKDDTNTFSVGYIIDQIDEGLFLHSIDTNGFDDGLMFMCLSDIYLLESGTTYLENLKIVNNENPKFNDYNSFILKRNHDNSIISDFLDKCLSDKKLVTVSLYFGKGLTGFINRISDDQVVLDSITLEGENDGVVCFKMEEINRIYFDGIDQRRISILFNIKNKDKNKKNEV
jgi:hypothetical protein